MQKVEGSSPFIRLVSSQLRPSDRWRGPGYASDVVFFCSRNAALSDRDRFLAWVNSRLRDAEVAVHEGDAGPRREIWSRKEPVSVLGALNSATGRPQVDELFTWMEGTFSGCTSFRLEIVAAEVTGDIAYTVAYEHTEAIVNGESRVYSLRATQVYRREDGEWKVVHRHGSAIPERLP